MASFLNLRRAAVFIGVPVATYLLVSRILADRETSGSSKEDTQNEISAETPSAENSMTKPMSERYASVFKDPELSARNTDLENEVELDSAENAATSLTTSTQDSAANLIDDKLATVPERAIANIPSTLTSMPLASGHEEAALLQDSANDDEDDLQTFSDIDENMLEYVKGLSKMVPTVEEAVHSRKSSGSSILSFTSNSESAKTFGSPITEYSNHGDDASMALFNLENGSPSRTKPIPAVRIPHLSTANSSSAVSDSLADEMKVDSALSLEYERNIDSEITHVQDEINLESAQISDGDMERFNAVYDQSAFGAAKGVEEVQSISQEAIIHQQPESDGTCMPSHVPEPGCEQYESSEESGEDDSESTTWDIVETYVVPGDRDFELLYALANDGEVYWWRPDASMVKTLDEEQIHRFYQLYPEAADLREEMLGSHFSDHAAEHGYGSHDRDSSDDKASTS
ncbi:hypothetical protein B0T25DRAFT_356318 [Lasiosphaeria hispida]|uniref:Uncharacterized protein n=1 Tax=Lasiosphaeria hispida TaxID=260671 RepID=A0AAJ0H7T0_9PEZI|nr:hypothetical protein B0T25DRAFT_356318 [Lasiosphaeria hispida]